MLVISCGHFIKKKRHVRGLISTSTDRDPLKRDKSIRPFSLVRSWLIFVTYVFDFISLGVGREGLNTFEAQPLDAT